MRKKNKHNLYLPNCKAVARGVHWVHVHPLSNPPPPKKNPLRILYFNVNTSAKNGIGEHYIPIKK